MASVFCAWASTATARTWRASSIASCATRAEAVSSQLSMTIARLSGEGARPLGARRQLWCQLDRPLAVGQGLTLLIRRPRVPAETLRQYGSAQPVIPRLDQRKRVQRQRLPTSEHPDVVSRLGGATHQLDLAQSGQHLGASARWPRLEMALIGGECFGVRCIPLLAAATHAENAAMALRACCHAPGCSTAARAPPTVARSDPHRARGQRRRGGAPARREHVFIHGLCCQGVAEHVVAPVFGVPLEDMEVQQLPDRNIHRLGREWADATQQPMVDPWAPDGDDPEHLSRRR